MTTSEQTKNWEIKAQSIDLEDVRRGGSLQNGFKECRKGLGGGREDEESKVHVQEIWKQHQENSLSRTMDGERFQSKEVADSDKWCRNIKKRENWRK